MNTSIRFPVSLFTRRFIRVKLLTIVLLFGTAQLFAQNYPITGVNISMPANPDANTANWGQGASPFSISAQTKLDSSRQVNGFVTESRILVTIRKGGGRVCGIYINTSAPASNFNSAFKVWNGRMGVSLLGQDCVLPAGEYQLCVQFFGNRNGIVAAFSDEKCKSFTIAGKTPAENIFYQAPKNISPADGAVIKEADAKKMVTFRWTPVVPRPKEEVLYKVRVLEIRKGQSKTEALRSNTPIEVLEVKNITQITYKLGEHARGIEIVWDVEAVNAERVQGSLDKINNAPSVGRSEATAFRIAIDNDDPPPADPPTAQRTALPGCNSTSTTAFITGSIIHLSDDFELKLTENPTGDNTQLTGKGTVDVKWIGVLNVQFDKIKINGEDKLCSGAVYTISDSRQEFPTQWAINVLNNTGIPDWTVAKIKSLAAGIDSNKTTKPLIEAANNVTTPASLPLNMPLGYFKNGDDALGVLGFTEMIFHSTHAEFSVIASLKTKGMFKESNTMSGTDGIGLVGTGIEFTNAGLHAINGEIKLAESISFTYAHAGTEALKLTFNKEEEGHMGNAIIFSDTSSEFWTFKFDVNAQLPREWLVPVDPDKTNVDINFQGHIINWDEYVLQGSLPPCIIPNTNGAGLEIGNVVYDHSSNENFNAMVFPAGYGGNTNEMFCGFYLKDFSLTLPDQLRTYADTSQRIKVGSENLIIDKDGITGKIFAVNVLMYPTANISNLGASIDTVNVSLVNSALTEAQMLGRITLPMSSSADVQNAINYSCLFLPSGATASNTSTLTFTLRPNHDIKSKFLGDGEVTIYETSSLNLVLSKTVNGENELNLDVDINGKLYYLGGKIIEHNNPPIDIDLSCNFEHVGMTYIKNSTQQDFNFSIGHWSFASPQKRLCGFAFSITDVKPRIEQLNIANPADYIFKGGIEFVAKINIGTEKVAIGGDVKIFLEGAVVSTPYNGNSNGTGKYGYLTHLKPEFLGIRVEDVNVDVKIAAAEIKGHVAFYKNDPVYGNAFMGELSVKFTTLSLAIQAGAIFGNTKYRPNNTGPGFKYWMVQAQVNLPPPGIVFMTGLAFRGFGAGVYSRMKMTPPAVFNPTTAASSTFGGAVFTPDETVSIGFKAKAIIATTPKEETFNGSVALGAEFNTSGGINFIDIEGLFNCGAEIGKEAEAFANGQIVVHYDFPNKVFDMTSKLIINKSPISTEGDGIQTKLHIDGKQNKWFFKSGTPTNPNGIKVFGVSFQSYFMFGNDLGDDIPRDFMPQTRAASNYYGFNLPSFVDNATGNNKYQSAKGFAFGLGMSYYTTDGWDVFPPFHGSICNCDRYFRINYNVIAGGEIDASLLQYNGCPGFGKGWRAKVSMAMYAGANLYYEYNIPVIGSDNGTLAKISASFYATAEFPNPTYYEGELNGYFELCDYDISFHKHFQGGSQCAVPEVETTTNAVATYTQQNVSDSLNYNLIKNIITPGSTTGVSRTTDFSVLLNYPYNESFDLQEQQSSGQMKVRTFRASYTVTLTQDSINANPVYAQAQANVNALSVTNQTPPTTNSTATQAAAPHQPNIAVTSNTNITTQPTGQVQANVNAAALAAIRNTIELKDAGYDELGAKLFKIQALVNGGIMNAATNALKPNTSYKFQITGALEEKVSNVWRAVNYRNTAVAIKQTKTIYFKTNSDVIGGPVRYSGTRVSSIH